MLLKMSPTPRIDPVTLVQSRRHQSMSKNKLRIGKHFGPGGKYLLAALAEALDLPATAMQIFAGNPQRYWGSHTDEDEAAQFRALSAHMYKVVHSVYIVNICDVPTERGPRMSKKSLVNQLEWAERHGCQSLVFHPGSPKENSLEQGLEWCEGALREVLTEYQGPVHLLLENAAHRKKVGGRTKDLTQLCDAIKDERLGYCMDTTHAYAAGSDIEQIGVDIRDGQLDGKLRLIHFNTPDSSVLQGSQTDRHASALIDGRFQMDEIKQLFWSSRELPIILEGTPDLTADLAWLLSFELEKRSAIDISAPAPKMQFAGAGMDADAIP